MNVFRRRKPMTPPGYSLLYAGTAFLACGDLAGADTLGFVRDWTSYWPAGFGLLAMLSISVWSVWTLRRARTPSRPGDGLDWRSLADNIAENVLLIKNDGQIVYANRDLCHFGCGHVLHVDDMIEAQDLERWTRFLASHESGLPSCATDVFHIIQDGNVGLWEIRLAPVETPDHAADYLITARSVSDSHQKDVTKDVLYKITVSAAQTESLSDFAHLLDQQLSRLVDTSNFSLTLYDKTSGMYTDILRKHNSIPSDNLFVDIDLSGGLTDFVRRTGKAVLMNEENREELRKLGNLRTIGEQSKCWLGIPLRTKDDVLGVLVVQSYEDSKRFTDSDAGLLTIVAGSAGRALERRRAQVELVKRESELRLFTDRLPALIWSVDLQAKFNYVSGAALNSLGIFPYQLVGKPLQEVFILEDSDVGDRTDLSEISVPVSFRFKMAEHIFEAFMEPVRDDEKRIVGATGVALDVTDSLHADRVAQRFFDISADSFIIISADGDFISANRAYLDATGFELEDRIGTPSLNMVHPEDRETLRLAFESLRNEVPIIALDLRIRCKNGEYKNFIWNAVVGPEDGLVYASGKDVTERLAFERALRERKEQLRLFVKHSPAALAMFDHDMNYIVVSDRWYVDYNLKEHECVGKNHYEVFPDLSQEWKDIHKRCLEGASESCVRDKFARTDGTVDWVRWEVKPWYNGDGKIGGIVIFTEVITKQVEAELELEHTRGLARQIVDASLDAVVAIDSNGLVTEWNPQAEKIFGFTRAEALGEMLHNLIVPDQFVQSHRNGMRDYLLSGHNHVLNRLLQLPAKHKDGRAIQVELSICPLKEGSEIHFSSFIRDITERLASEQELQDSRARLKEAQRIAKVGFWEFIVSRDEMTFSEEKLRICGRPNEVMPISSSQFLEYVYPDDRHFFAEGNTALVGGENSFAFQYRIVRPNGEIRHAFSEGIAERDPNGMPIRVFGTTLDVTDRVLAEARIRESEKRLALALDGSSDGFWDWNVVSGDCYFSPRIIEWLEYDPSVFEHHVNLWEQLIDPKSLNIFNRAFEEHVRNRSTHYEIEERIRTYNGHWIWVLSRGKIVEWNEDGTPLRAAGTWTNITERKLMEARATQLGRILDNSVNEVYVVDPQTWRFLEANLRARSNTGYILEELQHMTIGQLVQEWSEEDGEKIKSTLVNSSVEAIPRSAVHLRKDGSTYQYETSLQLMEWNDRFVLVSIGSDVTEKLKAEREYQNLENRIRHNQRLETIGTLAGGIAHDFNNILTPILGYADIAASELDPNSPSRQDLEHVIQAAYRAKGLVQQILAFSRHDEQVRQPLKVDMVVKETVRLLRGSTPRNTDFVQNIFDVGTILSDPTFINQILMNLCTNSFQAIGDHGGMVEVTLRTHEFDEPTMINGIELANGNYALLIVRDTGTGMDSATRERIFEPFFTTKDVGHGTGLGLSVVHGIVKSHRGAIDVHSEPDKGTTIAVYLPIVDSDIYMDFGAGKSDVRGSEHVLLCDDDDTILLLGRQMLESFGFQVTATSDPVAALAMLAEAKVPVSVLIVDDVMPILTGIDVAKSAHDFDANLPVILLSAGGCSNEDAENFAAVLSKPVSSGEMAKQVRKCIDNPIKENDHEQNSHH